MPACGQPRTIPAGSSATISGKFWGWTVLQCGQGATWSEGGGSAQPMVQTIYPARDEDYPWGDVTITSDPEIATILMVATSKSEGKRLPPAPGNTTSQVTPSGASVVATAAASLVTKTGSGAVTAGTPAGIQNSLVAGVTSQRCIGISIAAPAANTAPLIVELVSGSGIIAQVAPGQTLQLPIDVTKVPIYLDATAGTQIFYATAYYA